MEDMTAIELAEYVDFAIPKCRHLSYRRNLLDLLRECHPEHEFTKRVIKLHWDIKRDEDFRNAVRKEVKLLEASPRTG